MANLEEIVLALKVENQEFKAQMLASQKAVNDATVKMADAVSKFSDTSQKNVSFFTKVMENFAGFTLANVAVGAFNMAKDAALNFAKVMIVDSVNAAMEAEASTRKLAFALAQTGLASAKTMEEMDQFATKIQATTMFQDDAVKSAMALIQGLGALDKEGLKTATQAAIDLSSALGIDLQTAARAVGKAAEGETAALSRYGVVIDDNIPKSQKFAAALEKINERFGGAAVNQAQTFSGALAMMGNQFGEIQETIGGFLTGNKAVIAVMQQVSVMFQSINKTLGESGDAADGFISSFVWDSLDALAMLVDGLSWMSNAFVLAFKAVQVPVQAVVDTLQSAVSAIMGDFSGMEEAFKETEDALRFEFVDTGYGDKIRELSAEAQKAAVTMEVAKEGDATATDELTKKNDELSESLVKIAQDYARAGLEGQSARDLQKALLDEQLNDLTTYFSDRLLATQSYYEQEQVLRDQKLLADTEAVTAAREQGKISEDEYNAALAEIRNKYDVEQMKAWGDKKKVEDAIQKDRIRVASETFGALASLSSTGIKELGGIAKAGALAQATIDGYAAVQKALASAPPPWNFVQAAAVGVATAANVAKISATPLATGIDSVPMSAGGGNMGDNFPAVLSPGERVVPRQTNQDLTNFLQNQGSQPVVNININIPNAVGVTREQAMLIVEGLNEYIASGGLRLVQ